MKSTTIPIAVALGLGIGLFITSVSDWYESRKRSALIEERLGIHIECDGSFVPRCWIIELHHTGTPEMGR